MRACMHIRVAGVNRRSCAAKRPGIASYAERRKHRISERGKILPNHVVSDLSPGNGRITLNETVILQTTEIVAYSQRQTTNVVHSTPNIL